MTLAVAIQARLLTQAALTALVSSRIYTLLLPPQPTLPAVRIQPIDVDESVLLKGPIDVRRARVQIDSVAESLKTAEQVDAAVHGDGLGTGATGLSGWRGDVGSPPFTIQAVLPLDVRQLFDAAELRQFRVSRDYFVWFVP